MFKVAYHPNYVYDVPANHKFPMHKYEMLANLLVSNDIISSNLLFQPEKAQDSDILLAHDAEYVHQVQTLSLPDKMMRRIGFHKSKELIERELTIMQGSIDAALFAMEDGIAFNIAGGTHHAFSYKGEGFCIFNDLSIAALAIIERKKAKKVLIVDLDVHQGNGSAEILQNNQDVFTFSMHGADNYPIIKEKSDLDIALKNATEGKEYLDLLEQNLNNILENFKADLILYQSGVDVLESDKFGKMKLTIADCKQRDYLVYKIAFDKSIPVAAAMGGGYSEDINIILEAHLNTYKVAKSVYFTK
jgi:acetoin utilization deacetylase AcuC-like enzyme